MVITFAIAAPVGGTYTAPTLNSWLAGNYFAGIGQINAVAATSDAIRITGVIVLPGIEAPSAARSPLIMRPYDQELVTCKRYYEKLGSGLHGAAVGPTIFCGAGRYSVEKRVAATLTGIAAPSIYRAGVGYSTGSGSVWSFNVVASDSKGFGFEVNGFTGLVNGAGGIFNGSDQITADARL
jgi:hypothetical protein